VRAWRIVAAVVGGLVLVFAIAFFLFFGHIAAWAVKRQVIPKVENRLGRDIQARKIRVGYGTISVEGITVRGQSDPELRSLATVERVSTTFDFWPALKGDLRLGEIKVEKPHVALVRTADGKDNWSDILERLKKREPAAATGKKPLFTGISIVGMSLDVEDAQSGVRFAAREVGAGMTPGGPIWARMQNITAETVFGPHASASAVQLEADASDLQGTAKLVVEGGEASLWRGMSLTGIHGTVEPAGSRASIHFEGGYGGVSEKLWEADGWLDPRTRDAELSLTAARFTLDRLAPILAGTPVQDPGEASVETTLEMALREGETLLFRGHVKLAGLTLADPLLAEKPLKGLGFEGRVTGRFLRGARMLEIEEANIDFRGVKATLEGYAALKGGREQSGETRAEPRLGVHVTVPEIACQKALDAIPPSLASRLQGFKLKGDFHADVHFDVDWSNLDALVLDGSIAINDCKIKEAPKGVDADRLLHSFEHTVELEEDKWISFVVGPPNPNFVPLYDVSPYLVRSFLTTEDSGFYNHKGFIVREFRSAMIKNLKEGYFKYGASSITMQFVKNVLLYREKTVARKLQELILTWYVEQSLEKDRILEIYVNVIEFGPGIYGIGPAARHYFGKHPRDLNPVEAAFFSSILPSPKKRHLQYCDGELNRWGDAKVHRILKVMRERDRLTEEEYQAAMKTPLIFDRTDAPNPAECKKITKRYIKNARPTMPQREATN
jgi:hypothetical protein